MNDASANPKDRDSAAENPACNSGQADPSAPTDQTLIGLTLDGDTAAFGQLVSRHQNRIYSSLVHLMRNEADAEDAAQDAFVLAFRKLHTFQGKSQFSTWLFRIARNAAISRMRKRKPNISLDAMGDRDDRPGGGANEFEGVVATPSEAMERQEDADELMRAMGKLSAEHREILVLREMEDMDYDAIGEVLCIAAGTVRSRLYRARAALKEQLETILAMAEKPTPD